MPPIAASNCYKPHLRHLPRPINRIRHKIKEGWPYGAALLSGGLLPFAFAPHQWHFASFVSLIVFLKCLSSVKKGFLVGWLYGAGFFGYGIHWIYISIHHFGNAPPLLAGTITGSFALCLALFPASLGAVLNRFFPQDTVSRLLLAFPALWTLLEILRGSLLTGFPWLYLGYAQLQNPLSALAPWGSVWLVSWATALTSSLIYGMMVAYSRYRHTFLGLFLILWGGTYALSRFSPLPPETSPLHISLVQGNIAQLMRWDKAALDQILHTYQSITQALLASDRPPDVIVWPENAVPFPLPFSYSFFQQLNAPLRMHHTALIAGVPTQLSHSPHYYNSLLVVGQGEGLYHKRHLVPFGEHVPFSKYLRGLIAFFDLPMSDFVSGPSSQPLLQVKDWRFAPAICYEIAYPRLVQKMSQQAQVLLTVSNDTWFGSSIGPPQHLEIAQFRALETKKYLLRATNTGITAIITPQGTIQSLAPSFEVACLSGSIFPNDIQTPWVRWGIFPLLLGLCLCIPVAWRLETRKKERPL